MKLRGNQMNNFLEDGHHLNGMRTDAVAAACRVTTCDETNSDNFNKVW